jgi:bisphosphoglycerate-independent phosphoglycerate mutase (AlkP superfamily)
MSEVSGTLARGKGGAVVVQVKIEGKLNDPQDWAECLEKLKTLFKQYGSITITEVKKK